MDLQYGESLLRQHPIKKNERRKSEGGYSENLKMNAQMDRYCQYFPQRSASIRKIQSGSQHFTGMTSHRFL